MTHTPKMLIHKKDTVQVLAGKEKGKRGKVLKVFPTESRLIVEKVNFMKKHMKAQKQGQQSQILQLEAPLRISNVMLVCPNCGKPARVGRTVLADGTTVRN